MNYPSQSSFAEQLEARQNDVLLQLDELDRRVEAAIAEFLPQSSAASETEPGDELLAPVEMSRLVDGTQQPQPEPQTEQTPERAGQRDVIDDRADVAAQ